MFRLLGLVISIGVADSLNPTTIGPALYLATGERARERVAEFTIGVFAVYLVGGVVIALGPGQLLLALVPHPGRTAKYIIELVVGVVLLLGALVLWRFRERLTDRDPPDFDPRGRASWVLGATITAVELPTAFPYFATIAAIVGADLGVVHQLILLVLFNVCFVLPLLAIIATLTFAGERADRLLGRARAYLHRRWPHVLACLLSLAGIVVVVLGLTGLTGGGHGRLGRFMRRFLHP
jgi:cytochrome c biogenesis protein CcdA